MLACVSSDGDSDINLQYAAGGVTSRPAPLHISLYQNASPNPLPSCPTPEPCCTVFDTPLPSSVGSGVLYDVPAYSIWPCRLAVVGCRPDLQGSWRGRFLDVFCGL